MPTTDALLWADALTQAAEIRAGNVSAAELTDAYLQRIDEIDPTLLSYIAVTADSARAEAARADELVRAAAPGDELPPFLGVTISLKDVVDMAGVATTESCKALVDHVAEEDSPVVRRYREAGFVILGKTNVPEFCTTMTGSELNGICRNPWDLERTPGGSSGGAAAALAAALCGVAHGSDGAGSVRVPASYTGLVGLKPTRGLSTSGPEEGRAYYGTAEDGVLSRSVRDAAAVLDTMTTSPWSPVEAGAHAAAVGRAPGSLRVAVTVEPPMGAGDDECAQAARDTAALLESMGHRVVEATPSWATILAVALAPGGVGGMTRVPLDQVDQLEPRNRRLLERDHTVPAKDHVDWVARTREAGREFRRFWDDIDVLITPTCGIPAPSVDFAPWDQTADEHLLTFAGFPNFAQPFNLSGQPALSLPLAVHSTGLPVGVQLVGRLLEEPLLFSLAATLEEAQPWADRRPSAI
ncbi:MAG: amidase [Actinomycetota bacterium]